MMPVSVTADSSHWMMMTGHTVICVATCPAYIERIRIGIQRKRLYYSGCTLWLPSWMMEDNKALDGRMRQ